MNTEQEETAALTAPVHTPLDKPRQERFCQEYIIDLIGQKAARRAGYATKSAHNTAMLLLRDPKVQDRIKELQQERQERTKTDQDFVVAKLRNWSDGKITDYYTTVGRGRGKRLVLKDLHALTSEQIDSVQEIGQDKNGSIRIKLVDKLGATRDIGRHLGMFQDNVVVTPLSFEALMLAKQKEEARAIKAPEPVDG
jgi:phage terminase small subunit